MKQLFKFLLVGIVGGIVSLGIYTAFVPANIQVSQTAANNPNFQYTNFTSSPSVPLESLDFVTAANRTVNAVVHVNTTFQAQKYYNPWSQIFGGERYFSEQQKGSGSIAQEGMYCSTLPEICGAMYGV